MKSFDDHLLYTIPQPKNEWETLFLAWMLTAKGAFIALVAIFAGTFAMFSVLFGVGITLFFCGLLYLDYLYVESEKQSMRYVGLSSNSLRYMNHMSAKSATRSMRGNLYLVAGMVGGFIAIAGTFSGIFAITLVCLIHGSALVALSTGATLYFLYLSISEKPVEQQTAKDLSVVSVEEHSLSLNKGKNQENQINNSNDLLNVLSEKVDTDSSTEETPDSQIGQIEHSVGN